MTEHELQVLSNLLFPQKLDTPEEIFARYPRRQLPEGAAVTRFAPSPTGFIHFGAMFPVMTGERLARRTGGVFYLRIEDTDRARYVDGATELIEDTLEWLGLDWDEGPIVGGAHGPYFQSERMEIYHDWARKLIAAGRAYADPTPPEQVEKYRQECSEKKVPLFLFYTIHIFLYTVDYTHLIIS